MDNDQRYDLPLLLHNAFHDNSLTFFERVLYREIIYLTNNDGFCKTSNKTFATIYKRTKSNISKGINRLVSHGYIRTETVYLQYSNLPQRRIWIIPTPVTYEKKPISINPINRHTICDEAKEYMENNSLFMGIYVLWGDTNLNYIGKTTVGMERVITSANEHRESEDITHFSVIPISSKIILDTIERMYILEHKPYLNKSMLSINNDEVMYNNSLVDVYKLDRIRLVGDDFYAV